MMNRFKISGGRVITGGADLGECTLLVEEGCIKGVEKGNVEAPDYETIDATGRYVMPGFIDIHTHGSGGHDFMDCSVEGCKVIAKEHAKHGTTLMFPTTMASDNEELFRFLDEYETLGETGGAAFGGLHLEGPYFAYAFRGAQDPKYLKNPSPKGYMPVLERCKDIKRWSIAPELPGALELGRELAKRGIVAAIAHTDALYDDVVKAHEAGYSLMTHFYSRMNGFTRRGAYKYAGCIEAAYLIDDISVELIGDGIHVPAPLLKLVRKNKDLSKIILCTDSMRGAGMPEGTKSVLGSLEKGQEVVIENGVAFLADRSCFAGSVCTTERMVKTMWQQGGATLPEAVVMATENPANIMGYGHCKGKIKAGYDADLVICSKELDVEQTFVKGVRVCHN